MKHLVLAFTLLYTLLSADEMKYINNITQDIQKIRLKLQESQLALKNSQCQTLKLQHFTARPFRLKNDANIYADADVNAEKLFMWEEGTSFTSYTKKGDWIQITGYFVDKKWQSAQKKMWIKVVDTKAHEQ